MNINCVICAELFVNADNIFSTNCGHVFHHPCLIQWLERSKSCPQCRNKCTERNIQRIYFNIVSSDNLDNPATLLQKIDDLELKVRSKDKDYKENTEMLERTKKDLKNCAKTIQKLEGMLSTKKQINDALQKQIDILTIQQRKISSIESENTDLIRKLNEMRAIESVLYGTQKEVEEMLKQQADVKSLVVMVAALKRELAGNEIRKQEMRKQLQKVQTELRMEHEKKKQLEEKISELESENHILKNKAERADKIDWREADGDKDSLTPEVRRKRLLDYSDVQNTPSPLSLKELDERAAKINQSNSPFLQIKSSSIGLAPLIKGAFAGPNSKKNGYQSSGVIPKVRPVLKPSKFPSTNFLKPPSPEDKAGISEKNKDNPSINNGSLSIFKKPRLAGSGLAKLKSSNLAYNGFGGTNKILLSEEKAEARKLRPF